MRGFPRAARALPLTFLIGLAVPSPARSAADSTSVTSIDPMAQPGVIALDPAVVRRGIYRMHHRLIWEGAEEFTQPAHARTHGAKGPAKPHGRAPRPTFVTPASPRPTGIALPLEPQSAPANVRVNDPTGDGSQMVQAELSIAAAGITAILSWNDSK